MDDAELCFTQNNPSGIIKIIKLVKMYFRLLQNISI